jgi:subtilisin family serine protease
MHVRTRIVVAAVAAAAITGALPPVAATAAPANSPVPANAPSPSQPTRTVTLITGDRLSVATDGSNRFTVIPTEGREHAQFTTTTVRGHLEVMPADAFPLVRADRLDRRLFDVTTLLSYGYDDRRPDLPLIVTGAGGVHLDATGGTGIRDLPAVHGYAVKQSRTGAVDHWRGITGVKAFSTGKIWLDAKVQPTLDVSVPQIGAPQAWAAGYTGAAVPVAVVDTGIDATHPDLAGKVVAAQDFTTEGDTVDRVGHGTHVASTIAGSGAASGGRYKGVAPDAKLYSAKVCLMDGCDESAIIAGMQWAAATEHARVVNMSLGGADSPGTDPLEEAVQTLTEQYGTLFVVAAGNSGGDGAVGSPSTADAALSVGAVSKTEELADFSSRGPRGDLAIKPEITAPGVDIVAARARDFNLPGAPATGPDGRYVSLSGTSMATPHVAGSAAILAQQHPDWSPATLKATLMAAARPNPAIGVYAQGAGRVDVARAIRQTVTSEPTSVSFGRQAWPHTDDQPIAKTVSYANSGPTPVTLNLALHTTGPDGRPTADGVFTVSPTTVTVPAGGTSSVTVTADTRRGDTDGSLGGELTATAGDVSVQTPVAVVRDIESYEVTLKAIDRSGNPANWWDAMLIGFDPFSIYRGADESGTWKVAVPKGRYALSTTVFDQVHGGYIFSDLMQPVVDVDHDQTITLDARITRPTSVRVPDPAATLAWANLAWAMPTPSGLIGTGMASYTLGTFYTAQIGPTTPTPGLIAKLSGQWGQQTPGTREFDNSPYQYQVAFAQKGRYFNGFDRTVEQRELATVRRDTAIEAAGAWGSYATFPQFGEAGGAGSAIAFRYALPESHVEYYYSDPGVEWVSNFRQQAKPAPAIPPTYYSEIDSDVTGYQHGRTYREKWNRGVFGAALPTPGGPEQWVTRVGDSLHVGTPAYGDGVGRAGYSLTDTSSVTVYRDGVKVGTTPRIVGGFTVPAAAGRYRVVQEGNRAAPFTLSTKVSSEWTFRSGHVDGTRPQPLPVSAIRFAPNLDAQNRAPAGRVFALPVRVQHQPGSAARPTRSLEVSVSYDDGRTWTRTLALGVGDERVALLHHPAGGGYVSLKARATDFAGNTVEQTIVRAYGF